MMGIAVFVLFLLLTPSLSRAGPAKSFDKIILVSPPPGATITGKRPFIKCQINLPFNPEDIMIVLDGIDITSLSNITTEGFTYKPPTILPAGSHSLTISLTTRDGKEVQKELNFFSRHTKIFEEFFTENEITAHYEGLITKRRSVHGIPYSKIESNLGNNTNLKNGKWHFSFNTNVRYMDQNLPVYPPQKKGVTLINYLLKGGYKDENLGFISELGDIQVDETLNTVQALSRRGGKASFSYKNLTFSAFSVKSEQVYGLDGGVGIDGNLGDHIRGVSGQLNLFQQKATFKTIYVTGGEKESSFGIWTPEGSKKGSVTGFVFDTDFFNQKLRTTMEFDLSKFDPDTSDEFSYEHDKAYKIGAGGQWSRYSYNVLYEFIGKEYEVIGNQCLQKDRQGVTIQAGANYDIQTFNFTFMRYNDNVEDDPLYPKITSYQANIDYAFNKFQSLPIGLSYQKSIQDSAHEPSGTPPLKLHTDTVTTRINYIKGNWNFGLQGGYSYQNDRTPQDSDTASTTCSLSPGYNGEHFSLIPNFSYNRSKYYPTGVITDTYTLNLDLRGDIFKTRLRYELAATYNITQASDDSIDQQTFNLDFRTAYVPAENIKDIFTPSLGLMGKYNRTVDHIYPETDKNEFILLFFISTNISISL